jgi:hypothetical protein
MIVQRGAARYLIRDRDQAYCERFRDQMGMTEVPTAAQSLAECVSEEIHRFHSAGMPGPGDRPGREAPAKDSARYFEDHEESGAHLSLGKILPAPAACNRRRLEPWWRYRKLAAPIIATNVALRNRKGVEPAASESLNG